MTDEQIATIFGSLGRIEQKVDGIREWAKNHSEEDKRVAGDLGEKITNLRLAGAKQKGFFAGLATLGGALGASAGYLIERVLGGHH